MLNILLVEDYDDMRELISNYLTVELGAKVTSFESAYKAIANIQNGSEYDFIVTDYRLLNDTGSDLIEFLANTDISTPVVLFTSTVNPALKKESKNFLGIIQKPNFSYLKSVIQKNLNSPSNNSNRTPSNRLFRF